MKFRKLGNTDIDVSEICLGTMTWGRQNTEEDAVEQLDYATGEKGINFIDTAEMYAVPPTAETYTLTEQYIGRWLAKRGKRDDLVIATKVAGKSTDLDYARPGDQTPDLTAEQVRYAAEGSLKRLQTDYIDLYQVHWPSRKVNSFGTRFLPLEIADEGVPILETLTALGELVKEGKVRHVGLSNETPWGTMEYLRLAEANGLPRVVSVQNAYSLLNRTYEYAMSEVSAREKVGLLAYSPLASGQLSGKYLDGAKPEGARLTLFGERYNSRYEKEDTEACIRCYVDLAKKHGLDPNQMAIAFTLKGNFVTSSIIGATKMDQLRTDIDAVDVELGDDVMKEILEIGDRFRSPGC